MASKHDGKRAQANMWVTHQNLARAKGARPFAPKPKKASAKAAPTPSAAPVVAEVDANQASDRDVEG